MNEGQTLFLTIFLLISITHFGMFVALNEQPVEGLVHISMLGNEYFSYHADTMTLKGGTTGLTYGLENILDLD